MSTTTLIDRARAEIKLGDYRVAPATALADGALLPKVQEYRRQTGARMMPLDRSGIQWKIPKADYHVSRKVDGEFNVLIYRDGDICTLNPGGTVRLGLPFKEEAIKCLKDAKVKEAMIAGELFVARKDRRPRVHDVVTVARQPKSEADLKSLQFAVFDILSLDGESFNTFAETRKSIEKIFKKGKLIHPVEEQKANGPDDIEKLFEKWVVKEGAEGCVVRSDSAGLFKVKPRHTLDVAVIGFTESVGDREGMMHDLLLAVMRQDGMLQVLSRVGGGFSDEDRRSILSDLKDLVVDSEYAEVNSDHVAYQMVRPEWVIEVSCLDIISQSTRGGPINRMVLDYQQTDNPGYKVVRRLPLCTIISPQFVKRREDKKVCQQDIRIEQITSVVEVAMVDKDARQLTMPKSEVLRREVFTKQMKGETMVRKFVMWKTNKETESEEFPAYVLHYTDFSPSRKTPLSREVRVSSSLEQMESLFEDMKTQNIKKGWNPHTGDAVVETPAKEDKPKKKPAAKKAKAEEAPTVSETTTAETPAKKGRGKKVIKETKITEKKPKAKKATAKKKDNTETPKKTRSRKKKTEDIS